MMHSITLFSSSHPSIRKSKSAHNPSPSCQCTRAPFEKKNLCNRQYKNIVVVLIPIVDQVFLLLGTPVRKLVVVHPPRLVHEEVGKVAGGSDGVQVMRYILRLQSWQTYLENILQNTL